MKRIVVLGLALLFAALLIVSVPALSEGDGSGNKDKAPASGKEKGGEVTGLKKVDRPPIIDKPIQFGDERKALTLDYIHKHYDPNATSIEIEPKVIVLHWTAGCSFGGVWNTFNQVRISGNRSYIAKYGEVNVSSHFIVDRDGTIYQLMPETTMARHTIGLNWCAIGIENVGTNVGCTLTDAQVESNAKLVRYLAGSHDSIEYLIGHFEYGDFKGTPLWKALIPDYFTNKIDPGPEFMQKVRARVDDLGLHSAFVAAE